MIALTSRARLSTECRLIWSASAWRWMANGLLHPGGSYRTKRSAGCRAADTPGTNDAKATQPDLLAEHTPKQLPLPIVIAALRPALTNPAIPKVGHHAAFDLVVLRRYGIDVSPIPFDTMIAEFVSDPGSRNLGLKNLAWVRLGVQMTEIKELSAPAKADHNGPCAGRTGRAVWSRRRRDDVPVSGGGRSRSREKSSASRIGLKQVKKLFDEIEMPLVP